MIQERLTAGLRPNSVDPAVQQADVFPLQAFEFDDPNRTSKPRLRMKEPWVFEASAVEIGSITLADLSAQLQNGIEDAMLLAEENALKLKNLDGSVVIQGETIELKTAALDENGVPVRGGEIKLGLDEAGGYTEIVGTLRSANFDRDVPFQDREGWRILESGDAEFNSVAIRGFAMPEGASEFTVYVKSSPTATSEYGSIREALEVLSQSYQTFVNGGVDVTVEIEDGFTITEQIEVNGVNLGWITLKTNSGESCYFDVDGAEYFISVENSGKAPTLDLDIDNIATLGSFNCVIELWDTSSVTITRLVCSSFETGICLYNSSFCSAELLSASGACSYVGSQARLRVVNSSSIGYNTLHLVQGGELFTPITSLLTYPTNSSPAIRATDGAKIGIQLNFVTALSNTYYVVEAENSNVYVENNTIGGGSPVFKLEGTDGAIIRSRDNGVGSFTCNLTANTFSADGIWWNN